MLDDKNIVKPILKGNGEPIRKSSKTKHVFTCIIKKWSTWLPILVAALALYFSICANSLSKDALDLSDALSKLNLRPKLRLDSLFKSINEIPPHFTVTNMGPVEARQIKIRMYSHRYDSHAGKIFMVETESSNDIFISQLEPQDSRSYQFKPGWLNSNARPARLPQHNVMEIKITYRRPQDLNEYDESAYYFVNPAGLWVCEIDSSLKTELYEQIKDTIFDAKTRNMRNMIYRERHGDKLHSNQ